MEIINSLVMKLNLSGRCRNRWSFKLKLKLRAGSPNYRESARVVREGELSGTWSFGSWPGVT